MLPLFKLQFRMSALSCAPEEEIDICLFDDSGFLDTVVKCDRVIGMLEVSNFSFQRESPISSNVIDLFPNEITHVGVEIAQSALSVPLWPLPLWLLHLQGAVFPLPLWLLHLQGAVFPLWPLPLLAAFIAGTVGRIAVILGDDRGSNSGRTGQCHGVFVGIFCGVMKLLKVKLKKGMLCV